MADFEKAFKKTLNFEGGYSLNLYNQITTYAGISRLVSPYWEGWRYTDRGETPPDSEVKDYFFLDVWCPMWCHAMHDENIAWALFDHAIICGVETAVKDLQECLKLKPTGTIGCTTYEMLDASDELEIQLKFAIKRVERYIGQSDSYDRLIGKIKRAISGINDR